MKKFVLLITILTGCLTYSLGQTPKDTIETRKVFGSYRYYQKGKQLSMSQLINATRSNEQAYNQMLSAHSVFETSMILSTAGGFILGWPIGTALRGGNPKWALAGIGGGLILISIPISRIYIKKTNKAIDTFNKTLTSNSSFNKKELKFSMVGNGIGLSLRF